MVEGVARQGRDKGLRGDVEVRTTGAKRFAAVVCKGDVFTKELQQAHYSTRPLRQEPPAFPSTLEAAHDATRGVQAHQAPPRPPPIPGARYGKDPQRRSYDMAPSSDVWGLTPVSLHVGHSRLAVVVDSG